MNLLHHYIIIVMDIPVVFVKGHCDYMQPFISHFLMEYNTNYLWSLRCSLFE